MDVVQRSCRQGIELGAGNVVDRPEPSGSPEFPQKGIGHHVRVRMNRQVIHLMLDRDTFQVTDGGPSGCASCFPRMPMAGEQDHEQGAQHQEWVYGVGGLIWSSHVSHRAGPGQERSRYRARVGSSRGPFRLLAEREQLHAEPVAQEVVHLPAQRLGQQEPGVTQ